jgi:hypothetical protein
MGHAIIAIESWELEHLAEKLHRQHPERVPGPWRACPQEPCARIRAWLALLPTGTDDVASVREVRQVAPAIELVPEPGDQGTSDRVATSPTWCSPSPCHDPPQPIAPVNIRDRDGGRTER